MEYERLTPMMKQYFDIKKDYGDYILFYRLGDFYEMFFDDAVTASRELELTLTGRNAGLEERAPLCGVPYHSADTYIARLIEKGYKVAICEQTEDPSQAKGLVRREVVKIITPGTLTDPGLLKDDRHNYLLSVSRTDDEIALVYGDISTFEIRARTLRPESSRTDGLIGEILKIQPREILVHDPELHDMLRTKLQDHEISFTPLEARYFNAERGSQRICEAFRTPSLLPLGFDKDSAIIPALGALIEYIIETQKIKLDHFGHLEVEQDDRLLMLDQASVTNLELVRTLRNHDRKGSLVWVLDRTRTAMGARLLKKWLLTPLREQQAIEDRLNAVSALYTHPMVRDDLFTSLDKVYDLERLVSKLVYGQILPRDLNAIAQSLSIVPDLLKTLELAHCDTLDAIRRETDPCADLVRIIRETLVEDPPALMKDGGYIRADYNEAIRDLHEIMSGGKSRLLAIETREREATGIKNLKIKYNKVFGYYLEVTKSHLELVPERYIRKQTLANAERYITEELKDLENKILTASDTRLRLESEIFNGLRTKLQEESGRLLRTAQSLSQIDVLNSLAEVAYRRKFVRPTFNQEGRIAIEDGFHPVVEKIVGEGRFINNDAFMDASSHQFHIITGPNMAGKSTYLRQIALIAIMAQMGSFVPASSADLMLFDRVFTRVGASDDLTQGQSTFMVEMSELASILRHATDSSLVLLDEIGRGTSTYDGLSIAWSVVEYLTDPRNANPRTLFATHYHELTELEGRIERVKNYNITVEESGDDIIFLRKIVKGSANQSYGIQVARLAGVPKQVIHDARRILKELEQTDIAKVPKIQDDPYQVTFFREEQDNGIMKRLESLDLDRMTPIDALNTLAELKAMLDIGEEENE